MNIEIKKIFYILIFVIMSKLSVHAVNNQDAFIINEINTHGNWIELYANPANLISPVSDWNVTVCVDSSTTCKTISFNFDISTNPTGYFYVIDFGTSLGNWNNNPLDVRVRDSSGNEVNYFNLGLKVNGRETSLPVPSSIITSGIYDTNCDYIYRENASESNFARQPDGGCSVTETRHGLNTRDRSNNGGVGPWVPPSLNYQFDVWDTFRSITDRNISTKISGQDFSLSLAALNETNDNYQDFKGTVCTQVVDIAGSAKSSWIPSVFNSTNIEVITHNVASTLKEGRIKIVWEQDNMSGACPLVENNVTYSTDNFAVRPQRFEINAPDSATAGTVFNLNFSVKDNGIDYNEAVGSSFDVDIREQNLSCKTGFFTPSITSGWQFTQGVKNISSYYNEVGTIDINITENLKPCNLRFSAVDCDDQNISGSWNTGADLSIEDNVTSVRVLPHHFDVDISSHNFGDGVFTYLSKDLNMSSYADINITAKNEQNSVIENYNSVCYAQQFSLDVNYTNVDNKLVNFLYIYESNDINSSLNSALVNTTLVLNPLPKTFFSTDTNGSAIIKVYYNFERNASIEISPFDINITGLYVQDIDGVEGFNIDTENSTFYYGRVRPSDIETTLLPVTNPLVFEVYDTGSIYTSSMQQSSLFWYVNRLHIGNGPGHVFEAVASSGTSIDNTLSGYSFMYGSVLNGQQNLDITAGTTKKSTIHLKTQEWLWYVPSSFGSDYDVAAGTDCTMHPCFNLSLINSSAFMIESGDFNGTVIPSEDRGDRQREGIKLFR